MRLTRLYQFARNIRGLLHTYHYNQIFLTEFQGAYSKFSGFSIEPRSYGYTNIDELLSAIPQVEVYSSINHNTHHCPQRRPLLVIYLFELLPFLYCQVVWIKGHGHKRIIVLKNDMKGEVVLNLS